MTDRPANTARDARASVKEAIGKIMGEEPAIAKGGAKKAASKPAKPQER